MPSFAFVAACPAAAFALSSKLMPSISFGVGVRSIPIIAAHGEQATLHGPRAKLRLPPRRGDQAHGLFARQRFYAFARRQRPSPARPARIEMGGARYTPEAVRDTDQAP